MAQAVTSEAIAPLRRAGPLFAPGPFWVAALFCLGVTMVAVFVREAWRDDYWAIYNSDPHERLAYLWRTRIAGDVHPPFYFTLLYAWRQVSDSVLWARLLTFPILILGGLLAWLLGRAKPRETGIFLFLCASSYWLMYFGGEIRMYLLLFVLCALSVLIARRILEERSGAFDYVLFALVGGAAATSHYFGALWIACLGASAGLAMAARRDLGGFIGWALASLIAVAPAALWAVYAHADHAAIATGSAQHSPQSAGYAVSQIGHALIDTLAGNIALAIAGALCAGALIRRRTLFDLALAGACALTIALALAVHFLALPWIKDRGFVVIAPALFLLLARAVETVYFDQPWARRLIRMAPFIALATPFLFAAAIFKNLEHWDDVRRLIASDPACAGAPVAVYYRLTDQSPDAQHYLTRHVLAGAANGADLQLLDVAKTSALPAAASKCRIKGVALALPGGEGEAQAGARIAFQKAGLPMNMLYEHRFGDSRQLVFVSD